MNEKLFIPRGYYVVIMTYVPYQERPIDEQQVGITKLINRKGEKKKFSVLVRSCRRESCMGRLSCRKQHRGCSLVSERKDRSRL